MSPQPLTAPRPLDIIGADQVEAQLEVLERELADLERRAAEATAAADHAEQQALAEGAHAGASPWAIVRLQRFLDNLREEVERDAEVMIETANRQARARVDEAHEQAAEIRDGRRPPVTMPLVSAEPAPANLEARAPAPVPPRADPGVWARRPETVTVVEPAAPSVEPTVPNTPVVLPAPLASVEESPSAVLSPPVPAPSVAAEAPSLPAPSFPAPPMPAVPVADRFTGPIDDPTLADQATDVVPRPARGRRLLRAMPLSALLEMVAVVLIVVFILLRLG